MTWKIASLTTDERMRGIITLSAGNAAQAYAWAGRRAGVPVTVVMPAGAVRSKVEACLGYGAEVILHGADVGEALAEMERVRDARGLTYCHPFDDPFVIAGHGSIGLEIIEDLPEVDVVVVGVGGGGLISRRGRRPEGVAGRRCGCTASSRSSRTRCRSALERGEVVRIQPVSVADGLGCALRRARGRWPWPATTSTGSSCSTIRRSWPAMRFAAERMKQVLEPAGAAALAALLAGRIPLEAGDRVVAVACGRKRRGQPARRAHLGAAAELSASGPSR